MISVAVITHSFGWFAGFVIVLAVALVMGG